MNYHTRCFRVLRLLFTQGERIYHHMMLDIFFVVPVHLCGYTLPVTSFSIFILVALSSIQTPFQSNELSDRTIADIETDTHAATSRLNFVILQLCVSVCCCAQRLDNNLKTEIIENRWFRWKKKLQQQKQPYKYAAIHTTNRRVTSQATITNKFNSI